MTLTTRLKLRPTHYLWFLLIGMIIIRTEKVSAHAPPRAMYYGHRVEPREPLQHIPSSLLYGSASRDRVYDMPSCSQLRYMWKSSIKDLMDTNNNENLDTNEIPILLSNPYYTTLLWQQQNLERRPNFGKIQIEPTVSSQKFPNENRVESRYREKSLPQESIKKVTPIPGHFMEKPSQIGVVYGHVIHSPDEAQERGEERGQMSTDNKHHRSRELGTFGEFVPQADDINESNGRPTENNKQSSVIEPRTGSSFSSAEKSFKEHFWHNKPVIPSVSFKHFG